MDACYCLCGKPYDPAIFMIQCNICKDWFHCSCCNLREYLAIEIDKYHCPRCAPCYGPSTLKPYRNWHRHNFWEDNVDTKSVQTGTPVFIRELRARHFCSEGEVVLHMRGQELTEAYLEEQGFNNPIVIDSVEGLNMMLPPDNFSLYDVEAVIGGDYVIDVIDVARQTDLKMKLEDFVEYYYSLNRTRVFNVVSLEFSNTNMSLMVEAPLIARQLDWVHKYWPIDYPLLKPQVQKYCLMSVKDSYTDFHIDFGGTSVWYHVLRGEKIFYFIKPTPANLTLYQQWMTSSNQSETFFGDQVDQCFKCTLHQGQTMLIPTGWIHAVLTPMDSLVFGGNFLHSLNIPTQLMVYDLEKKMKTSAKFKYPNFEMINWFAAMNLYENLADCNVEETKCPTNLLLGLKSLLANLKHWNTEKDYNLLVRDQIPLSINSVKLLKDISKEIRHAERLNNQLNPPKPERESKRKRRKLVNNDFDYSLSPKVSAYETVPKAAIEKTIQSAPKLYERLTGPQPAVITQKSWPMSSLSSQEESKAIHRGGAVLKIKLGNKNIPSNTVVSFSDEAIAANLNSIYDFHDESDKDDDIFNFTIDESPRKTKKASTKSKSSKKNKGRRVNPNGIESLLKASNFSSNTKSNRRNNGGASPSTQEAIAGMLSIAQTCVDPASSSKSSRKHSDSEEIFFEDSMNDVHQDEYYVYPSLDNSDDEEIEIFKSRGKVKEDETWNPKARLGPLLPKLNRPAREGVKKQAVEKVLEAAAAKRSTEIPEEVNYLNPKIFYRKRKLKPKTTIVKPSTSTTEVAIAPIPAPVVPTTPSLKSRKGMKTVKQRLGKILKIHKMIH